MRWEKLIPAHLRGAGQQGEMRWFLGSALVWGSAQVFQNIGRAKRAETLDMRWKKIIPAHLVLGGGVAALDLRWSEIDFTWFLKCFVEKKPAQIFVEVVF